MDTENFFRAVLPMVEKCGKYALAVQDTIPHLSKGDDPENLAQSALTEADIQVQEDLLKFFLDNGFNFRIFAEEETKYVDMFPKTGRVLVTVDPIDGTVAYKNRLPNFCTVIAVYVEGCLDGVMLHTPFDGRSYVATQAQPKSLVWTFSSESGVYASEELICIPKSRDILITYSPKKEDPNGEEAKRFEGLEAMGFTVNQFDKKDKMNPRVGLNSILRGEIAAYFRKNVPCLDWGPISLIVEKAGGTVTDYNGNRPDMHRYEGRTDCPKPMRLPSIIVSPRGNEDIHGKLVSVLKR